MKKQPPVSCANLSLLSVPIFWPMAAATKLLEAGVELNAKNAKFVREDVKIHNGMRPKLATPNKVRLDLRTMVVREYGRPGGIPALVHAPFAGHSAMIADYQKGQSLVETLLSNGVKHVALTDWKSATSDMKDFDIDNYLEEVVIAIDDLGGYVNLVGLCQGGWAAAMVAARFPDKVNSLVLAGAPLDTDAGDGPVKKMAHEYPMSFFEGLVALGGGLMRGEMMLQGWKNMNPLQHYFKDHIDLYEHVNDPAYVAKEETFAAWYENPIDLPGRWYLQVITQLFKENRLAKGSFVALGRKLSLREITCPTTLLAGASDNVTTREQIIDAARYLGTPKNHIVLETIPGGHVGLFMGHMALTEHWPRIARWMAEQRRRGPQQHEIALASAPFP